MTLEKLAHLVREMRAAQKEYFATRRNGTLQRSKELERQVDKILTTIKEPPKEFEQMEIGL